MSVWNDYRVTCGKAKMPVLLVNLTDDGEPEVDLTGMKWERDESAWCAEVPLPWQYEVCPVCRGKGTHVNPSIDCDGLTREDFDEDPDFRDDYLRGVYDVPCNHCGGKRVVPDVDWDALSEEIAEMYREQLADEAMYRREQMAELRMGA